METFLSLKAFRWQWISLSKEGSWLASHTWHCFGRASFPIVSHPNWTQTQWLCNYHRQNFTVIEQEMTTPVTNHWGFWSLPGPYHENSWRKFGRTQMTNHKNVPIGKPKVDVWQKDLTFMDCYFKYLTRKIPFQENTFTLHRYSLWYINIYGKFSVKAFSQTTLLNILLQQCLCFNSPAGLYSVALNDIFHPSGEGGWMANFQPLPKH